MMWCATRAAKIIFHRLARIGAAGAENARDAVQAAKFISPKKSKALIKKFSTLASPYQAGELNRQLYIDGRVKTTNENVYYIVDLLYTAINEKKQVTFKYYEYTPEKKKVFKHNGQVYVFSPYDLVWSNDSYYVFGFSRATARW